VFGIQAATDIASRIGVELRGTALVAKPVVDTFVRSVCGDRLGIDRYDTDGVNRAVCCTAVCAHFVRAIHTYRPFHSIHFVHGRHVRGVLLGLRFETFTTAVRAEIVVIVPDRSLRRRTRFANLHPMIFNPTTYALLGVRTWPGPPVLSAPCDGVALLGVSIVNSIPSSQTPPAS